MMFFGIVLERIDPHHNRQVRCIFRWRGCRSRAPALARAAQAANRGRANWTIHRQSSDLEARDDDLCLRMRQTHLVLARIDFTRRSDLAFEFSIRTSVLTHERACPLARAVFLMRPCDSVAGRSVFSEPRYYGGCLEDHHECGYHDNHVNRYQ